jgi:polyhydroxybutyrate depolymerase
MRARAALAALVAAVGLAACGSDDSGARVAGTTAAAPGCPPGGLLEIDGGLLRMPAGARAGATPLIVVVVPGGDGDRDDRLGIGAAATRAGFAVLYPTSRSDGFWTLNHRQGDADVAAVSGLLARTAAIGCFDADRVSITGVSNGAGFAARLACELPGRFAAVVPVAAGYRALDPCPAAARTSLLDIHGTADRVVPYNGKLPDRKGSVPRYTAGAARRAGCSGAPRHSTPRRLVRRTVYRGCAAGLRVEALRLSGTDHGWPGAVGPRGRRTPNPSGLSATRELLRFVRAARRG